MVKRGHDCGDGQKKKPGKAVANLAHVSAEELADPKQLESPIEQKPGRPKPGSGGGNT